MTAEKFKRLLALCSVGATLVAASLPASAQGSGFYVGAGAGLTTVDLCGDLIALGATSCDDEDTGFKIFGGKRINQNLAVELGWVDLGEITATGPGGTARAEVDGIQVAAVGMLPVNPRFHVFGKVGLYLWDAKISGPGGSLSDDGTDLMFGFGASWNLAERLDLRGEWERFDVDGDDIDMLSVGLLYRF